MAGKNFIEEEAQSLDSFWLRTLYPDAGATFAFQQAPLSTVKESCIVVLDANVLLLPYRLGAASLSDIKKLFGDLAKTDRIFLPAQAVREFLKHRASRIRDVLRDLNNQASQIQVVADRKAGFLEADPGYQELVDFSQKIKDLKGASLKTISDISDRLRNGVGVDPVSSTYREVFRDRVVDLDGSISDEDLKDEMAWRYRHSIPPGYKDRNKPDDGIGDFLIWKTILQLAAGRKADCIFVTEDAKSDWWVQSEGIFQPRLELVEEYRRASGERTLHLLPFSGLLQLLGAQSNTVDEAKEAEVARQQRLIEVNEMERRRLLLNRRNAVSNDVFSPEFDRNALAEEARMLADRSNQLFREKSAIDRTLRDISSISDSEVAELYRRRKELDVIRHQTHQRRREIDEMMRNYFLRSDEEN